MAYKINTVFTATYDNLKTAITGVKSQFKSVETSAESAKKSVSSAFNTANKDIKEVNKSIKESSELINTGLKASAVGIATITIPTILAGKSALTMAGQYEAATQTLEYTLGEAKSIVDDFVQNNAQAIGMAEQEAYKFANIYSNLLTTMTSDQATNAEYTNKLMQASAVIMSKTGRTFTDVADRIRSGLLGNTEAIEDLGVQVQVNLLESTDAFKQIADGRSWEKLSFQEQQQIRLLGILEQTTKKYGEQVGDNLSLKLSQTSANFQNVKTEASKFFSVGLQPVLSAINNATTSVLAFVKWLNTLDDSTKTLITTFIIIAAIIPVVALVFFTLIKAINSYVIFTNTASASTKALAMNMLKVTVAALLLVAGLAMIAYSLGLFNKTGSSINKTVNGTETASEALDTLSASQNANAESAENASKANKELADNLQGFDEINKLSPDSAGSNNIDSIGPSIDLSGIDTSAFDNIGAQADNLKDKIQNLKDKFAEFEEYMGVIGGLLLGGSLSIFFGKIGGAIGLIIAGIMSFKNTLDSIKDFKGGESINQTLGNILLTIGLIMGAVLLLFGAIPALIAGLIAAIVFLIVFLKENWTAFCVGCQYVWETAWTIAKMIFLGIWNWLCEKVTALKDWFINAWNNIKYGFTTTWDSIKIFFSGIWNWVCQKADSIKNKFINVWTNIKNGFIDVWEKIKSFASNIGVTVANAVGGTIQGVVNSVIGFAENTINKFIRAINSAISLINAIPGVNIGYLSQLSIPRVSWFAKGGVFSGTSIIGVGEYPGAKSNPEIVAPQSMIYEANIEAIKDSKQNINSLSNGSNSITKKVEVELNLKSGGVKLGKQIVDLVLDANDFYDLGLL